MPEILLGCGAERARNDVTVSEGLRDPSLAVQAQQRRMELSESGKVSGSSQCRVAAELALYITRVGAAYVYSAGNM